MDTGNPPQINLEKVNWLLGPHRCPSIPAQLPDKLGPGYICAIPSNPSQTTQGSQVSNTKKKRKPSCPYPSSPAPLLLFLASRRKKGKKKFKGNLKPLHTPNEKIKMDVAGSCVLYVSKYFHLLLKFPLGVAKNSYRIVNTMVNLDSFYGETFPHPHKSLVSICPVTDKPEVLLPLPFCSLGWDQGKEAAPTFWVWGCPCILLVSAQKFLPRKSPPQPPPHGLFCSLGAPKGRWEAVEVSWPSTTPTLIKILC